MARKVKVGDVVRLNNGELRDIHAIRDGAAYSCSECCQVRDCRGRVELHWIAHVLVPRRRVLGYVVREGLERGKGRYYGPYELDSWQVAKEIRAELRESGTPCRIVTVVAKPKTKETAK